MKVDRLVIDSNVWIAALISPAGTARQLMDAGLDHDIAPAGRVSAALARAGGVIEASAERGRVHHHSVHMGPPDHESFQGLMTVTPAAS